MADRQFDKTQLRESHHGEMVHRDYLAHSMRWSWAARNSEFGIGGKRVLDVGCGQDLPLWKATGRSMGFRPELYVGVDLNVLPAIPGDSPSVRARTAIYSKTNFTDPAVQNRLIREHGLFNRITNFEVYEHMTPAHGLELLRGFHRCLTDDGFVILSTPVYNGQKMAANHINEPTVQELQDAFSAAGFTVVKRYGTFASVNDLKPAMRAWFADRGFDPAAFDTLYESLQDYHSNEVLSNFVAPLIPDASRNNVWVARKA